MRQVEIARRLGTSVDTIRRQQKRMGCAVEYRREVDDELRGEVIALHQEGLGSRRIANRTALGARSVVKILREAGINVKARRPLSPEKLAAIHADIRGRRDFLCRIAKKYGVGLETVRRMKKKILGPAPLKSTWPPLQSKFSQIDAAEFVPSAEQVFLMLVRKYIDGVAEKYLREGRDAAGVMAAKRALKNDPTPIVQMFEAGLREAVATLCLAQATCGDAVH